MRLPFFNPIHTVYATPCGYVDSCAQRVKHVLSLGASYLDWIGRYGEISQVLAIGYSAAVRGIDAYIVRVEVVGVATADPTIHIVGLPDRAIQESKERVNAAVRSCGFLFPTYKVVVNLAPADIRKEGAAFDLALALSILAMDQQLCAASLSDIICIGELALDGAVKPVGGVLPIAIGAQESGFKKLLLPADNTAEAALVDGLLLYPVRTLQQAVQAVLGLSDIGVRSNGFTQSSLTESSLGEETYQAEDLCDVRGQHRARRALEVAAAGGHNVLMVGAPGSGKTMLARRVPSILPSMTPQEALEVTKLYSVSGLLREKSRLVTTRPFRAPHHSVTAAALIGGGAVPRPGEVSLAHRGVLFLDELPEFPRHVLESLRQPLEDHTVTVSRLGASITYPSDFMLVASLNPCPCGYSGDRTRGCSCSPYAIGRYLSKLSGPLLDRIDMHVEVPRLQYEAMALPAASELTSGASHDPMAPAAESSSAIRARVEAARICQRSRLNGNGCNASIPMKLLRDFCRLKEPSRQLLSAAARKLQLSARAHDRIIRVSRTIADLAGDCDIGPDHLSEAISYRSLDRSLLSV